MTWVIAAAWLGRQQRIGDGIYHRAEVWQGLAQRVQELPIQVLDVVLTIGLQQLLRQGGQQLLLALFPLVSDRAQPTPNAPKPQASLGGWAPRAPGTGGGGPRGPGAPFQRPENGNCAKRISKSGRAQSPPAYIKPQEPARPPADSPPGGEQSAGPWPGRPGVGTTTDPLTKGLA